jgi:hypothetical protein
MELGPFLDVSTHQVDDVLNVNGCNRDCCFPNPHCMAMEARMDSRVMYERGPDYAVCLAWQEASRVPGDHDAGRRGLLLLGMPEKGTSESPPVVIKLLADLAL